MSWVIGINGFVMVDVPTKKVKEFTYWEAYNFDVARF